MFNVCEHTPENGSHLRDKHLCAISEAIGRGGQPSVLASELAKLGLESTARLCLARQVVVGYGQRQRAAADHTKEQKRAAMFAFKCAEQLQLLVLAPLDALGELLDLRAAILVEEESRIREQSGRLEPEVVGSISEEDIEKVVDAMMRRLHSMPSMPTENDAPGAAVGTVSKRMPDQNQEAQRRDLRVDCSQLDQLAQLFLPGVPAWSTVSAVAEHLLGMAQRTLDLYPVLDEVSELGARGDRRWKGAWRRLGEALGQEQRVQRASLRVLRRLCVDLAIKERVRMEAQAPVVLDFQDIKNVIHRKLCRVAIERALLFNMSMKPVTDAADEVSVDLGLPREENDHGCH
jgi:hypothetical protein